jgi:putative membrane protein
MEGIAIRVLINAVAIYLTTRLVPGIQVQGAWPVLGAGLALAVINALVRPALVVLTLPLTVLTLGLFLFVLNAVCFWLASQLVPGFEVRSFGAAFLGALVVSIVSWIVTRSID